MNAAVIPALVAQLLNAGAVVGQATQFPRAAQKADFTDALAGATHRVVPVVLPRRNLRATPGADSGRPGFVKPALHSARTEPVAGAREGAVELVIGPPAGR